MFEESDSDDSNGDYKHNNDDTVDDDSKGNDERMMTMTREDAQHIRNLSPSVTQSPLSRPNALAAGFGGGKSHNGSCNISIKLEPAGPGSGSPQHHHSSAHALSL